MANVAKVRKLLSLVHDMAIYLTEEEISEIGEILLKAAERMEKENPI